MRNATRVFVSTFGAIMALAGIEHGIGEVLQGSVAPSGVVFQSWPDSAFFSNLGGEPAMTVIPNLLVTGMLAILFSLALLTWATLFVQRKNGGLVMILICLVMLLVGGGIFPPILGMIIGVVGTKIDAPLYWWRTHLPVGVRRFLGNLWPWSFVACVMAWPALIPGVPLLNVLFGVDNEAIILTMICFAIGSLLLTIFAGFAYDAESRVRVSSGAFNLQVT